MDNTVGANFKFAHLDELAAMSDEQIATVFPSEEEAEFTAEVQAQMEAEQSDPRKQMYFLRTDTKTIVKNEEEYFIAMRKNVPMKQVSYGHAMATVAIEKAREAKKRKTRVKNKTARAARRRNR
jgi:hypothetical protein